MEAFFDKPGEVYAIEIYKYLVENCQLQKLLDSLENWRETYLTRLLWSSRRYAQCSQAASPARLRVGLGRPGSAWALVGAGRAGLWAAVRLLRII